MRKSTVPRPDFKFDGELVLKEYGWDGHVETRYKLTAAERVRLALQLLGVRCA